MFVSSYNTYIHTNPSQATEKQREEREKQSASFPSRFVQKPTLQTQNPSTFAVDYIAKNNTFWQKLELQKQEQNGKDKEFQETTKLFANQKTLSNAKQAYTEGAKFFSLFQKHTSTLDQTPKIDKKLPEEIKDLKEKVMRNLMVSTYIANESYYKITA